MSKKWKPRPPAVFRLDQDDLIVDSATNTRGSTDSRTRIRLEPDFEALAIWVDDSTRSSRQGVPWAMLFWCGLAGLLLLGIGVAVSDLITGLLARNQELGWLALAFAMLAIVSVVVIAIREATGLMRLTTIEKLRQRAAEVIAGDNRMEARALVHDLLALTAKMPHLARGRADLEGHLGEIIDGADMVRLAERELMTPLDQQASKIISMAATRVSVVTAVSPRAVVDVLFVFVTALILVRRLAFLYGARPGTLSLARLVRQVVMHLAVTGGLAASDSLIQQMLGHGIAAKLSARLGEGVLNGLLTAR
ncbi:MAG TPA: TIGR01620 family protein, partial [Phototrophicaceae bacterium]|nr:TIGR01620 family protein [Phototrophicaceae bacterium]